MFATVFYFDILIAGIVLFLQSGPYHLISWVRSNDNPLALLLESLKRYALHGRMTFR